MLPHHHLGEIEWLALQKSALEELLPLLLSTARHPHPVNRSKPP
jgi:hypothetical protein